MPGTSDWAIPPPYLTLPPFAGPGVFPRVELFGPIPATLTTYYGVNWNLLGGLIIYNSATDYTYMVVGVLSGSTADANGPWFLMGGATAIAVAEVIAYHASDSTGHSRLNIGNGSNPTVQSGGTWGLFDGALNLLQQAIAIGPDFTASSLVFTNTPVSLSFNGGLPGSASILKILSSCVAEIVSGGLLQIDTGGAFTIDGVSAGRGVIAYAGAQSDFSGIGTGATLMLSATGNTQVGRAYQLEYGGQAFMSGSTNVLVFQMNALASGVAEFQVWDSGSHGPSPAAPGVNTNAHNVFIANNARAYTFKLYAFMDTGTGNWRGSAQHPRFFRVVDIGSSAQYSGAPATL